MPGHVLSCPECDSPLRLPDAPAPGKRLKCPRCAAVFEAPGDEDEEPRRRRPARAAEDADEEDGPRTRRRKSARRRQNSGGGAGLVVGLVAGGIVLLLVVGGVGIAVYRLAGAGAAWQEFAPAGGGFRVLMPGVPAPMSAPAAAAPGLEIKKYRARGWRQEYVIAYGDLPADTLQRITAESLFQAERDAVVQAVRGRVVSEKDVTLAGQTGKEYQIAPGDGKGLAVERIYLARHGGGLRFYSVAAAGPGLQADSPDLLKFFDSFHLTDAGAGGPAPGGFPRPGGPMPGPGMPGMPAGAMPGAPPGVGVPGQQGRQP